MNQPYSVTLPWNPNDPDEGDYATTVWADSDQEARFAAAEEMADHSDAGRFDSAKQRQDYIENRANSPQTYVVESATELKYNLGVVFAAELFPDGIGRSIDLDALRTVLMENRNRVVIINQPGAVPG